MADREGRRRLGAAATAAAIAPAVALPAWALWRASRGRLRRLRRVDLIGVGGALLLAAIELGHGDLPVAAGMLGLALVTGWGSGGLRCGSERGRAWLLGGLVAGLAASSALAAWQALASGGDRASGWPWTAHPNLFAHGVLAIAALAVTRDGPGPLRIAALAAALPALAFAGGRAALLGWLLVALVAAPRRARLAAAIVLVPVAVAALAFAPRATGLGPGLQALVRGGLAPLPNLLVDTEALEGPAWRAEGSRVRPVAAPGERAVWRLARTDGGDQAGLRQLVVVNPGDTYTLAAELRPVAGDARPGLLMVRRGGDGASHLLQAVLGGDEPDVRARGALEPSSARQVPLADGWTELRVTLRVGGERSEALYVGPLVDGGGDDPAAAAEVRALRLVPGVVPFAYVPVDAEDRAAWTAARIAFERITIWRVALDGVGQRPLVGHGADAFPAAYLAHPAAGGSDRRPPVHAHSLPLHLAFSFGLVGLLATAAVFAALAAPAVRRRDGAALAVLAVFLVLNLVDATLAFSGVLFPVAALLALPRGDAA